VNENTRSRHIVEWPVGGDVDRRSVLKLTGAGLVAAPLSAAPWRRSAKTGSDRSACKEHVANVPQLAVAAVRNETGHCRRRTWRKSS
jgi:hypothetical protein